jgi:hypothetical protein
MKGVSFYVCRVIHSSPSPLRPSPLGVAAAPSVVFRERCGHGCDPDDQCSHVLDDDAPEVLLYACKTIERGEQLLLDYGGGFEAMTGRRHNLE